MRAVKIQVNNVVYIPQDLMKKFSLEPGDSVYIGEVFGINGILIVKYKPIEERIKEEISRAVRGF